MLNTFILLVTANEQEQDFDPDKVTSGPLGFFAIVVLVAMVIVLCVLLVRTLRRINYREQVRAEIADEKAKLATSSNIVADPHVNVETNLSEVDGVQKGD